ncbi:MAG: hypothetical protein WC998_01655 [Candidatus Paceibacterota bacterium]|jgi:hypothetical protein
METVIKMEDGIAKVITFKTYNWYPKEDITAYELALCVPFLNLNIRDYCDIEARINNLPPQARRHFVEVE